MADGSTAMDRWAPWAKSVVGEERRGRRAPWAKSNYNFKDAFKDAD